jgi:hypothetical protein
MSSFSEHVVERVLREVKGDRVVLETRLRGVRATTRVLLAPVHANHHRPVEAMILQGRGSPVGLPPAVSDIIEAYRIRLRLPRADGLPDVLAAGVLTQPPAAGIPMPPADHGWVFVTTRWMEGRALDDAWLGADEPRRRWLAGQVAARLEMLHEARVSYGDLKPSNVVVDGDQVSLIDLDTLREMPDRDLGVRTTAATQEYAAPEQVQQRETFLASDVWAFGEMLARLITGLPASPTRAASAGNFWGPIIVRCQQHTPGSRPTAAELAGWLLQGRPLPDRELTARVAEPELTRRVAEPAARSAADAGEITRPVPSARPSNPTLIVEPDPSPADLVPPVRPPPDRRWMWLAGASAAALAAVVCLVWLVNLVSARQGACARVEGLRGELQTQKTVADKNNAAVLNNIIERLEVDAPACDSDEARGLLALTRVWGAGWHFRNAAYKKEVAEAVRPLVDAARGSDVPEAQAAVVGFDGALCRLLPDGASERVTACARSHEAAARALSALDRGPWRWLRVEVAWADVMTALGEAQRFKTAKQLDQAHAIARAALPGCFASLGDLASAPVNGPELLETCMRIAGFAGDLDSHLQLAAKALEMATQTSGGIDNKRLARIYETVAPECAEVTVGKDKLPSFKGRGAGGWPDWCAVAGARAVGCGAKVLPPEKVVSCRCDSGWYGSVLVYPGPSGTCADTGYGPSCVPEGVEPLRKEGVPWERLIAGGGSCPF